MKKLFVSLALAAAMSAAWASPYAPHEFDFSDLPGISYGLVESVRQVQLERDLHSFQEAIEHRIQPETGDRLSIRLDDGRALTVVQDGMRRFEAGQRVRIVSGTFGAHVERE